ncbi:MAG: ABC transporter ATP-binding protein [Alphaproteobacteria bacterium]|nr:ABC transporter ATP-binding protein [Alphaproteobacteria bacterium]
MVEITGLEVEFLREGGPVTALHGVTLGVRRGESVGLVGESGSGKSITWLAALGLLSSRARVRGRVRLEGQDLLGAPRTALERVRGRRIAMIFQDPASCLNPVHRIGRQIGEALRLHRGLAGAAAAAESRRLLTRVGIADAARRLDDYPHELSGGMNQRVMIAMALAGQPDLLIADEPTTALDATVQAQILALIDEVRAETGMALVLISHDLGIVAERAERVWVMYAGRIVESGPAAKLFSAPAHPYTQGLLAAVPSLAGPRRRLATIPGTVPDHALLPPGCSFAPRCQRAEPRCAAAQPAPVLLAPDHVAACVDAQRGDVPLPQRRTIAAA